MYTSSSSIYDALYNFKDYDEATRKLHALIQAVVPSAVTLLDVGCGTGKHLEYLSRDYRVEGLDINEEMLQVARRRCPGIMFYQADMTQFSLGRTFDVVTCLFSAIAYVRTVDRLQKAIAAMASHLSTGGLLVVEPWIDSQRYRVGEVVANFVNDPELKIAWMYLQEIVDRVSVFNIHYLVGTPAGITQFAEKHEMGLFTHAEYVAAFERCGFSVQYDPEGLFRRGLYIARRQFSA
jgi:SAM-dependent methyltransferase